METSSKFKRQFIKNYRRVTRYLLLSVILLSFVGCNQSNDQVSKETPYSNTQEGNSPTIPKDPNAGNIDIWPSLDYSKTYNIELEAKIKELLSKMTLEQKIAQMIQPEIRDFTVEDMRRYGFGSYLNGGGAFPNNDKHASPEDWITLAENMYQASIDDTLDGSSIPAIWGR